MKLTQVLRVGSRLDRQVLTLGGPFEFTWRDLLGGIPEYFTMTIMTMRIVIFRIVMRIVIFRIVIPNT